MPLFKVIKFLGPVHGLEQEFNNWYDNGLVPACLSIPEVRSAQRFLTGPFVGEPPATHALIVELEAGTLQEAAEATGITETGRSLPTSDAVDAASGVAWGLTPIGPYVHAEGYPQPPDPDLNQYKIIAFLDAQPGRDDEFGEYYETVHMANSLTIPENRGGQRFVASPVVGPKPPGVYATIYDWEASTVQQVFDATRHLDEDAEPLFPPPHGCHPAADYSNGTAYPLTPVSPIFHSAGEALDYSSASRS
jgi:hypothetical protein